MMIMTTTTVPRPMYTIFSFLRGAASIGAAEGRVPPSILFSPLRRVCCPAVTCIRDRRRRFRTGPVVRPTEFLGVCEGLIKFRRRPTRSGSAAGGCDRGPRARLPPPASIRSSAAVAQPAPHMSQRRLTRLLPVEPVHEPLMQSVQFTRPQSDTGKVPPVTTPTSELPSSHGKHRCERQGRARRGVGRRS